MLAIPFRVSSSKVSFIFRYGLTNTDHSLLPIPGYQEPPLNSSSLSWLIQLVTDSPVLSHCCFHSALMYPIPQMRCSIAATSELHYLPPRLFESSLRSSDRHPSTSFRTHDLGPSSYWRSDIIHDLHQNTSAIKVP